MCRIGCRRTVVAARMRRAYHAESALAAGAELCALAAELDRSHTGAAASLREGMTETLTVFRLGLPPTLALRSTNAIVIWRRSPGRHACVRAAAVGETLTEGARRDRS
jgi:hypothetical protein